MANGNGLTVEKVQPHLEATRGNIAAAARRLGYTRQHVDKFVLDHPTLHEIVKQAREARVDYAESKLDEAINKGEAWAICFTLKTLGKSRGYVERTEITGADSGPITIRVQYDELDSSSSTSAP